MGRWRSSFLPQFSEAERNRNIDRTTNILFYAVIKTANKIQTPAKTIHCNTSTHQHHTAYMLRARSWSSPVEYVFTVQSFFLEHWILLREKVSEGIIQRCCEESSDARDMSFNYSRPRKQKGRRDLVDEKECANNPQIQSPPLSCSETHLHLRTVEVDSRTPVIFMLRAFVTQGAPQVAYGQWTISSNNWSCLYVTHVECVVAVCTDLATANWSTYQIKHGYLHKNKGAYQHWGRAVVTAPFQNVPTLRNIANRSSELCSETLPGQLLSSPVPALIGRQTLMKYCKCCLPGDNSITFQLPSVLASADRSYFCPSSSVVSHSTGWGLQARGVLTSNWCVFPYFLTKETLAGVPSAFIVL